MPTIYFDESGQTGTHLLDPNQPYFSMGSTDISQDEATEIIDRCFPRHQGNELKSQRLFKKPSGRRAFLKFAREVGDRPFHFCGAKIGKQFTVVCKMVDNLVEPLLRSQGYDFYANDYAVRFANMAHFAFTEILDKTTSSDLFDAYNAFARHPSSQTLSALQSKLEIVKATAPEGSDAFVSLMADGAERFEHFHDIDNFEDTNDLHVTAVLQCMGFWQAQHDEPFDLVHDESTHFFARTSRWEMMTNPDMQPLTIHVGEKSLRLPLRVKSTTSAKSHECASLELCDLIAGFISRAYSPNPTEEMRQFIEEAINEGMGQLSIFPVDAGTDFIDGPPQKSSGPDVIDQIIDGIRTSKS